jgi:hypothetical protein
MRPDLTDTTVWNDINDPSEIVSVDGIHPRCDLCGMAQQPEDDWNGETGNHRDCEATADPVGVSDTAEPKPGEVTSEPTPEPEPDNEFVQQCRAAGIPVEAYAGRFYWRGPAARWDSPSDLIEVARATTVNLQWDSPLVYPVKTDKAWFEWANRHLTIECSICGEPDQDQCDHDDD